MPKPPRRPPRASFSDSLRDLIDRDPRAPHAIALAAGVAPSMLTRFLAGERGVTSSTLDALAPVLGLAVSAAPYRGLPGPRKRRRAAEVPASVPGADPALVGLRGDEGTTPAPAGAAPIAPEA